METENTIDICPQGRSDVRRHRIPGLCANHRRAAGGIFRRAGLERHQWCFCYSLVFMQVSNQRTSNQQKIKTTKNGEMRTPVSNFACAAKAFIFRTFSSFRFSCLLTRAFTPAASPASIFIKIRARPPHLCLARPNPLALGFDSVFYRVPFSRCRRADPYGAALCSLPCRAGRPA